MNLPHRHSGLYKLVQYCRTIAPNGDAGLDRQRAGQSQKILTLFSRKTSGITVYALGSCSSQTVSHSKLSGADTGDQSNLESYQMLRCLNILTLLNVGPYLLPPSPPPPFHI